MAIFDDFDKEFGFTTTAPEPTEDVFSQFDKEFGFMEEPIPSPAIQTEMPLEPSYMPPIEGAPPTTTEVEPAPMVEPQPRIFITIKLEI